MGINEKSIDKLLLELTQDGSEEITESNFVNFLPKDLSRIRLFIKMLLRIQ